MVRVKGGVNTRRKHKRILALAKGYWMTRNRQIRKAYEAVLHAGQYAFAGRKLRKRNMRELWITRINAALHERGTKYSAFFNALKKGGIQLDRKVLSALAVEYPQAFDAVVQHVKK